MNRSYLAALLLALLAVGWIASGQLGKAGDGMASAPVVKRENPLPMVRTRLSQASEKRGELLLFGRSEANRRVDIRAETVGRVERLLVAKGDRVEEGDVIAMLAADDSLARRREAEARVAQARAAYEAGSKLSEKDFRSRVKLLEEKATLDAALAALESIRIDIARREIRAPFTGHLDELPAEIGGWLGVGDVAARIIDLDPIIIAVQVSEHDIGHVAPGATAHARLPDGSRLEGTIRYVARSGSSATRTFLVEVAVPNQDAAVPEGLTVEVRLATEPTMAHLVSPSVLTLTDEGVVGLKAVGDDDRVTFHPAELVADTREGVWLSGLPSRLRLITVGQEFVLPGQVVQVVDEADMMK